MMQTNLKLKRAVTMALSILALGVQQQALALGLGEINVQSHLGQVFRAKVKVHGANDLNLSESNTGGCFKLSQGDGSALSGARFNLGPISNDEAVLTLSTSQIINDPILNFAITTECGSAIHRDYVVLLDPVLSAETDNVADEEILPVAKVEAKKAKKSAKQHAQLADTNAQMSVAKKVNNNKKHIDNNKLSADSNPNIVLHVPGGNTESANKLAQSNTQQASQPHLSISAGEPSVAQPVIASNLRLDRQLSFTPDPNAQPVAIDSDMQDEVTAMNNRLAHLSEEVSKLQSRNLALESDNKLKTAQISNAESAKNKLRWLGYALGAALVAVSVQLVRKWHWRREYEKLLAASETSWANAQNSNDTPHAEGKFSADNDLLLDDNRQNIDTAVEVSTIEEMEFEPAQTEKAHIVLDEEANHLSILDHADVFLSHGRTSLAIQLLQNHLLDHPKQSITIWLFLLDLMAKENMQAAYEQTALECKEHFNIRVAAFSNDEASPKQHLEDFPRLLSGLEQVWGTPAAVVYLDDLIYNSRLETRVGFDKSVVEELLMLKTIAQENVNSAQVIQLDEKKIAMQEQKEALLAAKKAEKVQKMDEAFALEQRRAKVGENFYEFNLVD